jgi:hypothetical protein
MLYNYIFWYNEHTELWYAIDRDDQLKFFNGNREEVLYTAAHNINTLIEVIKNRDNKNLAK